MLSDIENKARKFEANEISDCLIKSEQLLFESFVKDEDFGKLFGNTR